MKRNFRMIVGMLLLSFPLCVNAQLKPVKTDSQKSEGTQSGKEKVDGIEKEKPKGGLEMPKISGFVQGMYQANLSEKGELYEGNNASTFRMRRVRLSVDGNLSKTVSYKIQGDFVRGPMLVDAFLKYKPINEFAIQVGQFKTPFTIESPINPVNLEIFDYGEVIQKLGGYSDVCGIKAIGRDIGVMASGDLFPMKDKGFSLVSYAIGVFNGNGVNVVDNNNRKDLVGRLEIRPGLKDLTLSGSCYYGMYMGIDDTDEVATGNTNFGHGARNRWSAGAQYNDGTIIVRGEYINGETGYQIGSVDSYGNPFTDNRFLHSNGYYAVAGYNFSLGRDKSQKLMPVVRYEHFTKDSDIIDGGTNWYTAGINYWPMKSVNIKLDYSLVQKENGDNSHRVVGILSYKF